MCATAEHNRGHRDFGRYWGAVHRLSASHCTPVAPTIEQEQKLQPNLRLIVDMRRSFVFILVCLSVMPMQVSLFFLSSHLGIL